MKGGFWASRKHASSRRVPARTEREAVSASGPCVAAGGARRRDVGVDLAISEVAEFARFNQNDLQVFLG